MLQYTGYIEAEGFPLRAHKDTTTGIIRLAHSEVVALINNPYKYGITFHDVISEQIRIPGSGRVPMTRLINIDEAMPWIYNRRADIKPLQSINRSIHRDIMMNKVHLKPLNESNVPICGVNLKDLATAAEKMEKIDHRILPASYQQTGERAPESDTSEDEVDDLVFKAKRKNVKGLSVPYKKRRVANESDKSDKSDEHDAKYKGMDLRYTIFNGQVHLRYEDVVRRLKKKSIDLKRPKSISVNGKPPALFIDKCEFYTLVENPGFDLPKSECLDLGFW